MAAQRIRAAGRMCAVVPDSMAGNSIGLHVLHADTGKQRQLSHAQLPVFVFESRQKHLPQTNGRAQLLERVISV